MDIMLFRVVLIVLISAVYAPSLSHAPRADQWSYLVDTMQHPGLFDAIKSTYSYNRTRQTMPCDTDLFRPIVFVMLATERSLLEGDQASIQAIGIMLHCCVCLLLLSLLQRIELLSDTTKPGRDSYLAYAITIFYALNPAIQELIIWAHLQGYLLFLVFLLGSMNLLLRHVAGQLAGKLRNPTFWGSWALALLSAFTHEIGQLYAVLAGMFLGLATYRRVGIARAMRAFTAFATVLVIYQAVNIHDLEIHRGSYVPDNNGISIVDRMFTMNTISHSARFFSFTVIQPFCPSVLQASYDRERLRIEESLWNGPTAGLQQPEFLLSSLVFCAALYFGIAGLRSLIQRENHLPLLTCSLCGSLFAVYAGVTVLGRMNLQPTAAILSSNSYYTYTALLFAILTGFSLWQGVPRSANAHSSLWWNLFLGGLVALSLNGGFKVRLINACLAEKMKEVTTPLDAVNTFVREHRDEPDFSMAIDYQNSDPIPQRYDRWIIDIVFAKWIDPKPKYRIAIRGCDVVIQPQDEHFPMP